MNPFVIKILAVGLTLSQLFTRPADQFLPSFNPQMDQDKVGAILHDGCQFITKQFGAENIDIEVLLDMMVANGKAMKAKMEKEAVDPAVPAPKKTFTAKLLEQLDLEALTAAYKRFCKGEKTDDAGLKMDEVIEFYNGAMKDLPDHHKLKDLHLPESTQILDRAGDRFTEIYADNNRRRFVSIATLPDYVKQAFVAAEDKRFYQHHGVDIPGIIRAFSSSFMSSGRPQGGSTITQQVVKNLLVGDDLTFERKMREMVLATRVEKLLSKDEILELYLNYVYLGRASWGIEMASRSYFGKPARELSLNEAAFLAGLTRGPNYYNPDRYPDRANERRQYVLGRMKEDGYVNDKDFTQANGEAIKTVGFETPRTRAAFYYLDEIQREARHKAGIKSLTSGSYVIHSTIHPELQKAAETALEDGLAQYEASSGRAQFDGPVGSLAGALEKYNSTWQVMLPKVHSRLYDVRWPLAVVLDNSKNSVTVGLTDGRVAPLSADAKILRGLKVWDLVHVRIEETKKKAVRAKLMIPPHVQGAVVVLEAKTGRVLAMAGGFSYAASQLNRVTQTARQPGSTLKPFIYMAAMNLGFQPNTLVPDAPLRLPPIERGGHWWSPKDYEGGSRGLVTFRQAVERSLNLPTARIMASMAQTPTQGLDYIRGITQELGIYQAPIRVYPFVLGAQPARLIDMATAYATIANIGLRPTPHVFDSIEQNGKLIYERPRGDLKPVASVDRVSFYQTRRILEGTVERGTAAALKKEMGGYIGAKTGTSNNENDAWFVGFTNDLVVAAWVGYDSRKIKPSLGARFTGARVAMPIAAEVLRQSFKIYKDKEPMSGIPADLRSQVVEYPIDVRTGAFNAGDFLEVFRLGADHRPDDTRMGILQGAEVSMAITDPPGEEENPNDTRNLADDDLVGPDREVYQDDPDQRGSYVPGADNMYDLWSRRDRQVDPFYYQPPIFRSN